MDINMPIMDGLEASRRISLESKSTIVGLTGFVSDTIKEKGIESGMAEVVNKPVQQRELKRIVKQYCLS